MSSKTQTTATKEEAKPVLVPKLRFPEFRGAKAWESGKVDDLVDTVTPPKKLPTALYASSGAFPIIDQSQSDICGWTDDNEALIRDDLPLIVFGDHTCILKLIAHPFAQGADGIKILKTRPKLGTPYLYQFLSYRPVATEEYKRHYSILKEKIVYFPEFKSGEQQKIAECLSSVDELMAAQARKVDALKTHKKGLMQQLFPREGETQPRLRFPEFQNAGEWEEVKLKDLLATVIDNRGKTPPLSPDGYPLVEVNALGSCAINFARVSKYVDAETYNSWFRGHVQSGDVLFSTVGAIAESSVVCDQCQPVIAQNIVGLRFKRTVSHLFGYYLLNALQNKAKFLRITMGAVQPSLKVSQMVHLSFRVSTSLPEQHRIATCLSSLDALITSESQKHEALKTHKKGLMQQLFPSPEEQTTL